MTTVQLYKKADHADDIGDLDLTEANPVEIIRGLYGAWYDIKDGFGDETDTEKKYSVACRLVKPYRDIFKGELRTSSLAPPKHRGDYELLLSGVLNTTGLNRIIVDNHTEVCGYRLKPGKAIETTKDGQTMLGWRAEGGVVINRGKCDLMGQDATGGTFVNFGKATWMGTGAKGGTYFNFGKIGLVDPFQESYFKGEKMGGMGGSDNVLVVSKEGDDFFFCLDAPLIDQGKVNRKYATLAEPDVSALIGELEAAARKSDYASVTGLARKVDAHVRNSYKRRVA